MKKWFLVPLFLILVVAMVFTGCEQPAATTTTQTTTTTTQTTTTTTTPSGPYGTITVAAVDFGYESTDPIFYESLWGWAWYDSLLRWDINGNFIGGVADSWSVSED